jgi:anti-sigma regulatory factor (Ser/Thr protein kinase)
MSVLGRNPSRIIPAIRDFMDMHPGRRVTCLGEPVWAGRAGPELREAARHEALTNLAFADDPLTIVCPYDVAALPPDVVAGAACTHPVLTAEGHQVPSPAYLGAGRLPPGCESPLPPVPPGAVRLDYSSDLRAVRALVAGRAAKAGLPEARAADLVLAVSEVTANTLRHTCATGTLAVWWDEDEIVCQVEDAGHITDPLAGRWRPAASFVGRQGLWVVNQVCDLVELRSAPAGTTVRMHMRLAGSPSPLPAAGTGGAGQSAPLRLNSALVSTTQAHLHDRLA